MEVRVARWGNSLGVRIPKAIAGRLGLAEGTSVEIETQGECVVISRAQPRYALEDLLLGMTPRAMSEAFDWGPDAGRESVE